jgi:Permease for cytosine/purines, uracil, thiamine, allantoin
VLHRGEPAERRPRLPGRRLALALGALATGLAALVGNLSSYQSFLLLLGALFVPLFGVLAADWFVLTRRRYDIAGMYRPDGPYRGVRWPAVGVWLAGFLVYNWINPGTVRPWVSLNHALFSGPLHLPFPLSTRCPWRARRCPPSRSPSWRCWPPGSAPTPDRRRPEAERPRVVHIWLVGPVTPCATSTTPPGHGGRQLRRGGRLPVR